MSTASSFAETVLDDSQGTDWRIVRLINDGLIEVLGRDAALAVRVCLDSSVALAHPLDYQVALVEMVGARRARAVVTRLEKKLRAQVGEYPSTRWMHFALLMSVLRGRYSDSTLLNMS